MKNRFIKYMKWGASAFVGVTIISIIAQEIDKPYVKITPKKKEVKTSFKEAKTQFNKYCQPTQIYGSLHGIRDRFQRVQKFNDDDKVKLREATSTSNYEYHESRLKESSKTLLRYKNCIDVVKKYKKYFPKAYKVVFYGYDDRKKLPNVLTKAEVIKIDGVQHLKW